MLMFPHVIAMLHGVGFPFPQAVEAGMWFCRLVCVSSCACLCIHFDIFGIVVDAFREEEIEENVEEEEE